MNNSLFITSLFTKKWQVLCGVMCLMSNLSFAESLGLVNQGHLIVDAKANIYGATQTAPPAPGGGGGGILPSMIELPAQEGLFLQFPNIIGQISCADDPSLYNDADGGTYCLGYTLISSAQNKLSGMNYHKTMFLSGVFVNVDSPDTTTPSSANLANVNQSTFLNFQLNQVFFIGDGYNNYGQLQSFYPPPGATHLFLGFVDGNEEGQVGFYDDNLGQLNVEYEIRHPVEDINQPISPIPLAEELMSELVTRDNLVVDAKANIYGATKAEPPAPGGGGAGLLPPMFALPAGEKLFVSFPNITGQVSCTDNPPLYNGPEGETFCLGHTSISSYELGGFSNVSYDKSMFLVGVFTTDSGPNSNSSPSAINFSEINEHAVIMPKLNQIFLIGDGHTHQNQLQSFYAPSEATRLFLGFIDISVEYVEMDPFEDLEINHLGFYDDNVGQLEVELEVYKLIDNPNAFSPPAIEKGLIAYYPFDGDFRDNQGFHHGSLWRSTVGAEFVAGKYSQAIKLNGPMVVPGEQPYQTLTTSGLKSWSISTWFFHHSDDGNEGCIISPTRITMAEWCRDSQIIIQNGELGTTQCDSSYYNSSMPSSVPTFHGSGFFMSTLTEDWHHLTAVGNDAKTDYYIDGNQVGQADYQSGASIWLIGCENPSVLDDFRIYDRALSPLEIKALVDLSLPPLGQTQAVNALGDFITTNTLFAGGTAVNKQPHLQQTSILFSSDIVEVTGEIKADPSQIGQTANIFVYVEMVLSPSKEVLYLMLGEEGQDIRLWDQNFDNLIPFRRDMVLQDYQRLPIYRGHLNWLGTLRVFLGYRLADDTRVMSGESIDISIHEPTLIKGTTTRVSINSQGEPATNQNFWIGNRQALISANGRYVVFYSDADNLAPSALNVNDSLFIHDRQMGETNRISEIANFMEEKASISAEGGYIAIPSFSPLISTDNNAQKDIFVYDRLAKLTTLVSVDNVGNQTNENSFSPAISADARYVAFSSLASNLVVNDTNEVSDIFIHDRQTGETKRVSIDSSGNQANLDSVTPAINADGHYIAFVSEASNLIIGDTNNRKDIFIHDHWAGTTTRVSLDSNGQQGNEDAHSPSISADGRYVVFASEASNLVPDDTNNTSDIFVHDVQTKEITRVSVDSCGFQGNDASVSGSISGNGRYVVFTSEATNLVVTDTNDRSDIFVHDRQTKETIRVSVDNNGLQGNGYSDSGSISADGGYIAYISYADNLVAEDINDRPDIFVFERYLQ